MIYKISKRFCRNYLFKLNFLKILNKNKMTINVIAEIGSVHDGSFGNSKKLIELAKECGSDFVKFQYHIAKHESLKNAINPKYFNDEKRYDYFERTSFTLEQWKALISYAKI